MIKDERNKTYTPGMGGAARSGRRWAGRGGGGRRTLKMSNPVLLLPRECLWVSWGVLEISPSSDCRDCGCGSGAGAGAGALAVVGAPMSSEGRRLRGTGLAGRPIGRPEG